MLLVTLSDLDININPTPIPTSPVAASPSSSIASWSCLPPRLILTILNPPPHSPPQKIMQEARIIPSQRS